MATRPKKGSSTILGIDGGATNSRATIIDAETKKILWSKTSGACNVLLSSKQEVHELFESYVAAYSKKKLKVDTVGLCLAGVVSDTVKERVREIARRSWAQTPTFVSHDLSSALYSGIPDGEGIVALCGTGACVYGHYKGQSYKMGAWGHILGDEGSAYNIAHRGLRWIIEYYDKNGSLDILGKSILKEAKVKSLAQLARYVNNFSKRQIAKLSIPVFNSGADGHEGSREIIQGAAKHLANNCFNVSQKLNLDKPILTTAGGVFNHQEIFKSFFHDTINNLLPHSKILEPHKDPGYGACLWTLEQQKGKKTKQKLQSLELEEEFNLRDLDHVNIEALATEKRNPKTEKLHELSSNKAVSLLIDEDKRLLPALRNASKDIAKLVDLAGDCLKTGGRIIYAGAGTSGRLGILDASECPPTFRADPQQVIGLIAGGSIAITRAVEGAEDFREKGETDIINKKVNSNDLVVGLAASGRTPYVWGALEEARVLSAKTALIHCNPPFNKDLPFVPNVVVSLDTGPESLTGSTRMRAGTATKMVLNILSTLAMCQLGKVWSNYMIDVKPTNNKLKARAVYLVSQIKSISKEEAFKMLAKNEWNVKSCLGTTKPAT